MVLSHLAFLYIFLNHHRISCLSFLHQILDLELVLLAVGVFLLDNFQCLELYILMEDNNKKDLIMEVNIGIMVVISLTTEVKSSNGYTHNNGWYGNPESRTTMQP